jgi:hypothetical protein
MDQLALNAAPAGAVTTSAPTIIATIAVTAASRLDLRDFDIDSSWPAAGFVLPIYSHQERASMGIRDYRQWAHTGHGLPPDRAA